MTFADKGTEDIFHGVMTKDARRTLPLSLHENARRKLDRLNQAAALDDLRFPPANRLEALHGDREGQHSFRVNVQYRICFVWVDGEARDVEIVDYH